MIVCIVTLATYNKWLLLYRIRSLHSKAKVLESIKLFINYHQYMKDDRSLFMSSIPSSEVKCKNKVERMTDRIVNGVIY